MDTVNTIKQGNAVMVPIPQSFHVPAGVTLKPKLTDKGIFYEFVDDDRFFYFDEDILEDLVEDILEDLVDEGLEGKELIKQFKERKQKLPASMDKLIDETTKSSSPLTKEQLQKLID